MGCLEPVIVGEDGGTKAGAVGAPREVHEPELVAKVAADSPRPAGKGKPQAKVELYIQVQPTRSWWFSREGPAVLSALPANEK